MVATALRSACCSSVSKKLTWFSFVIGGAKSLDACEHGADVNLLAGADVQFGEHSLGGSGDRVFHLHGLEPDQGLAGVDLVAYRCADADHRSRHRCKQRPLRDS